MELKNIIIMCIVFSFILIVLNSLGVFNQGEKPLEESYRVVAYANQYDTVYVLQEWSEVYGGSLHDGFSEQRWGWVDLEKSKDKEILHIRRNEIIHREKENIERHARERYHLLEDAK